MADIAVAQIQERVNQALAEGAQLSGGISVVWGRSSRTVGKMSYQAFQAVLIPDQTLAS